MTQLPAKDYMNSESRTQGQMKQAFEDIRDVIAETTGGAAAIPSLTVSGNAITPTTGAHEVTASGASDTLSTINTTNQETGRLLYLTPASGKTITVADGTGIILVDDANFVMDSVTQWLLLIATGTNEWTEVARFHGSDHSDFRTFHGLAIGSDVEQYDANTVKKNVVNEYSQQQNFNATTTTTSGSITWDVDADQVRVITLNGASSTLQNPTNVTQGGTYVLIVKQDGAGGRTLAYGTSYKWPGGTAPTLSTGSNAIDVLTFICDDDAGSPVSMLGSYVQDFS